jgi:undecaprenyl phosphate-alpha-L-ara4N flippase subunit ArnE
MNTVAQLSLKRGLTALAARQPQRQSLAASVSGILSKACFLLWMAMLVPSMLLWLKALSMTDLSFAYPFQSLSLVFIALGSIVLLKERVTAKQWVGIVLILIGIVLISRS